MIETKKQIGIIKWFDELKGFGILLNHESKEYFIHKSNILEFPKKIELGTTFLFEEGNAKQGKTTPAINCKPPNSKEDFALAIKLISQQRLVSIEVKQARKNNKGIPYIKREIKKFDIIKYFIFSVLEGKSRAEIVDLFKDSFDANIARWGIKEVASFYWITKILINALNFEFKSDENQGRNRIGVRGALINDFENDTEAIKNRYRKFSVINKNNYELINELFNHYSDNVNSEIIVQLWRSRASDLSYEKWDLLDFDLDFLPKEKLPFDQNYLIEHSSLLNQEDLERISKIDISNDVLSQLIKLYFSRSIRDVITLRVKIRFFFAQPSSVKAVIFDIILSKISSDLLFRVWKEKELYINFNEKDFAFGFPSQSDYPIDDTILTQNIDKIGYQEIKRIHNLKGADAKFIYSLLIIKLEAGLINTDNLIDSFHAFELLTTEQQSIILGKLYPYLTEKQLALLIENDFLKIIEKNKCSLLNYYFEIDRESTTRFISIVLKNEKLELITRLSFLKELDEDFFQSYLLSNIRGFNDSEKLECLSARTDLATFTSVCNYWLFEDEISTIKLLSYGAENNFCLPEKFEKTLSETIKRFSPKSNLQVLKHYHIDLLIISCIKQIDFKLPTQVKAYFNIIDSLSKYNDEVASEFNKQSEKVSITDLISLSNLFKIYELRFDNSVFALHLQQKINSNELILILEFLPKLEHDDYYVLEKQLIDYVNSYISENDNIFLDIVPLIQSANLLISVLKKCTGLTNSTRHINNLFMHKEIELLSEDVLGGHLTNYFNEEPAKILEFALTRYEKLYQYLANKIVLDRYSFIAFLKILLKREDKIINLTTGKDNDLNVITRAYKEPLNPQNIYQLQNFFKKYNYAFQSEYLKFNAYLVYKKQLTVHSFYKILSSHKFIELGALLIQRFVLKRALSREELMTLMNRILKEHFALLNENMVTKNTFDNIFSIRDLVKKCNGRKKYSGLQFWKGGNITRWYTSGNHFLVSGNIEDIYCEGNFWKAEHFYDSSTNRPTKESYNFYWCKNKMCAGVNDTIQFDNSFEDWTLVELNQLFDINLDRLAFTRLAGWLNRMKTIFDRLKCNECGELLRPKNYTPHLLGYYAVPIFICVNDECSLYNKEIRFTHCRGCGKILDSRECLVCPTCNWLICDDINCQKCGCGANYNPVYAEYP